MINIDVSLEAIGYLILDFVLVFILCRIYKNKDILKDFSKQTALMYAFAFMTNWINHDDVDPRPFLTMGLGLVLKMLSLAFALIVYKKRPDSHDGIDEYSTGGLFFFFVGVATIVQTITGEALSIPIVSFSVEAMAIVPQTRIMWRRPMCVEMNLYVGALTVYKVLQLIVVYCSQQLDKVAMTTGVLQVFFYLRNFMFYFVPRDIRES